MAPRSTLSKLALVSLASSLVPSASALTVAISAPPALGVLEERQTSTCANSSFSRCADSNLPSDFCCSSDSTCISLDSSSSALCCPKGADCSKIQPISCDLQFQDVSGVPDAAIKTTRLGDKLTACGRNTCCPFGYSCDNNSQCIIDKATSSTESKSKASSATSASGSTTSPTGTDSTEPAPAESVPLCPRFPGAAVAVGFFPGLLAGALIALLGVICLGRRRPEDDRPYSKGSSGSSTKYTGSYNRGRTANGTITGISDPIPLENGARTDFLRRQPSVMLRSGAYRAKSWFSSKSSPTYRDGREKNSPLNPVNHWKMPTPPNPNNIPLTTVGKSIPVTPPSQIRPSAASLPREPSTESIKIYSPPSMARPPSKSGFSPPSNQQHQHGLKTSIMEKLTPFKGTELKANKNATLTSPPGHAGMGASRGGNALDLATAPPSAHAATTVGPGIPRASSSLLGNNPTNPKAKNNNSNNTTAAAAVAATAHPSTQYQTPNVPRRPAPPSTDESRPLTHMTTFTDVLRDAGLEGSDPAPAVPAMPKALNWGGANGGKKKGTKKNGAKETASPGRRPVDFI